MNPNTETFNEEDLFVNLDTFEIEPISTTATFSTPSFMAQDILNYHENDNLNTFDDRHEICDIPPVDNGSEDSSGQKKSGQIKYSPEQDLFILKEIKRNDAHVAPHGQVAIRYNEIAQKVNVSKIIAGRQVSWKRIQDRYNALKKSFKERVAIDKRLSGSNTELSENELLLERLIDDEKKFNSQKSITKEQQVKRAFEKEQDEKKVIDLSNNRNSSRSHNVCGKRNATYESVPTGGDHGDATESNSVNRPKVRRISNMFDEDPEKINCTLAESDRKRNELRERELALAEKKFHADEENRRLERMERREERMQSTEMNMKTMKLMVGMMKNAQKQDVASSKQQNDT